MKKNSKAVKLTALPPDVTKADTTYSYGTNSKPWRTGENADLPYSLTFYNIGGDKARKDRGWVVTTLLISKGKRGMPDRSYSIGVDDGKIYTVGSGPHVQTVVTVYLNADNVDRLRKYVDLYQKGMADANMIRDRIGSRRAQTQLRRSSDPFSFLR